MKQQPPQTPEQQYHAILLGRLQRLVRLRWEYRGEFNKLGNQLLSRAITATYGDCLDAGLEELATPIMRVFEKGRAA